MSLPPKPLWAEGLNLDAQHFQQQDRYHEARLEHMAKTLNPHAWGVQSVRWNADALANNVLRAEELSVIFPDGEIYQAPASDALPQPFDLSKLTPDEQSVIICACLPVLKSEGGNLSCPGARQEEARYVASNAPEADLYTEAASVNVVHMRKFVRLLPEMDPRAAYESVAVARISRKANGGFELDRFYIPPALMIAACPALPELLRGLLEKLTAKINALYQLQRRPKGDVVEAHSGGASSFWMLGTLTTACASLSQYAKSGCQHPVCLFEHLISLAGALMAFSTKYAPGELPVYAHAEPGPGFRALCSIIDELLDTVVSSRYVRIPLSTNPEGSFYSYHAKLDGKLVEAKVPLYLAASANMPALELVAAVPNLLKIGAPAEVEKAVRAAIAGVELVHMAQVPMEVPVRPDTYYFSITNKGELYEAMMKARTIAIYFPSVFDELKLELFAITT